jgi:CHAD domain-containing protein
MEPLETNSLMQSSAAAAPPPGIVAAASLQPAGSVSSTALFPFPCPAERNGDTTRQPAQPATIRVSFSARLEPVAVGPALARALDSRWQSYRKQLRHCQEEFSEEAVHELRVATRRLLAQFTLLSCVVPSTALEKARRVLKSHLAALGDLRDTHVQRLFLEQRAARFPELVLLRSWVKRRERCLVKSAADKVNRFKNRKLERWISAMIGDLTTNAGNARTQRRLAATVLRVTADAFAEAAERRRAIDLAEPRTIHKTRVAFKRFRYMMESLSPGLTGLSKQELRALAYYQRKMGIIQDLEVMQECVADSLREHPQGAALLRSFCRHVRQRRIRALRSFVKTADRLFAFWPPVALTSRGDSLSTRHAA